MQKVKDLRVFNHYLIIHKINVFQRLVQRLPTCAEVGPGQSLEAGGQEVRGVVAPRGRGRQEALRQAGGQTCPAKAS